MNIFTLNLIGSRLDNFLWYDISSNIETEPLANVIMISAGMVPAKFLMNIQQIVYEGLTHWGWVTHICLLTMPSLAQIMACRLIWTNVGKLVIGPLGTNISEIIIEIQTFSYKKIHLKMPSGLWRPFCHVLNVLTITDYRQSIWAVSTLHRVRSCISLEVWEGYLELIKHTNLC